LLLLNTPLTRKKKRRAVAGTHITYDQVTAPWAFLQPPIGATEVF
jgi:hypothetical protein